DRVRRPRLALPPLVQLLGLEPPIGAHVARPSKTRTGENHGWTSSSSKPASSYRRRYSRSVRSRPPVITRQYRSSSLAKEGRLGSSSTICRTIRRPPSLIARRQLDSRRVAGSSSQSLTTIESM